MQLNSIFLPTDWSTIWVISSTECMDGNMCVQQLKTSPSSSSWISEEKVFCFGRWNGLVSSPTAKCEARRRENGTKNITFIYVYSIRRIFRWTTPCRRIRVTRVCWDRVWSRRNAEPQANTEYCNSEMTFMQTERTERTQTIQRRAKDWLRRQDNVFLQIRGEENGEGRVSESYTRVLLKKKYRRKMCGWWAYALFIFRAHLMGNLVSAPARLLVCSFAHTHKAGQHKIAIILHLSTVFSSSFQVEIYFNLCRIFDVFRFHSQNAWNLWTTCHGMRWHRTYPCRTYDSQMVSNDTQRTPHTAHFGPIADLALRSAVSYFSCGWLVFAWIRFECGMSMAQPTRCSAIFRLKSCVQYPAACSIVPQTTWCTNDGGGNIATHDSISLITQPGPNTHHSRTHTAHETRCSTQALATQKWHAIKLKKFPKHWNATSQTLSVRVPFV